MDNLVNYLVSTPTKLLWTIFIVSMSGWVLEMIFG